MPCSSDHMEPTVQERQHRLASELLVFVLSQLGRPVSKKLKADAENLYGGGGEENMVELCATIRQMDAQQLERIVYNGRSRISRKLADWWDEHQVEDLKRLEVARTVLKTAQGAKSFFDQHKNRDIDATLREYSQLSGFWYDAEESVNWFGLEDGVLIVSRMNGVEAWKGKKL